MEKEQLIEIAKELNKKNPPEQTTLFKVCKCKYCGEVIDKLDVCKDCEWYEKKVLGITNE